MNKFTNDIITIIFEFDNTYKIKFQEVIAELKRLYNFYAYICFLTKQMKFKNTISNTNNSITRATTANPNIDVYLKVNENLANELKEKYPSEDYYLINEVNFETQIKTLLDIDASFSRFLTLSKLDNNINEIVFFADGEPSIVFKVTKHNLLFDYPPYKHF